MTKRCLYEKRFVIPGTRRLSSLVQAAVSTVENEALALIEREIPLAIRSGWLEALSRPAGSEQRMTLFEYPQDPPGKVSPSTVERQADKIRQLINIGVDRYRTKALVPAQMRAYAQGIRRRRPSRFAQLQEPRRTLELVSFTQYALFEHTDNLIKLVDRQVARLWARASETARQAGEEGSASQLFVSGVRAALSIPSAAADDRITAIKTLLGDLDAGKLRPASIAARQRKVLVSQIAQIRPHLKALLDLDLRCQKGDPWMPLIEAWRKAFRLELSGLTVAMCPPKSRAWAALSVDRNSASSRNAAEVQMLWEVRQALRRGTLHVA
jgi:hypothetical protein